MFNKFLRLGIYAAIFLGGLVFSLYLTSKWIIQSGVVVVVPNLVGHDTVYALDLLTSLGLNIKVGGFMWSETVPKNFIASQEPASGTRVKRDRDVKVVLSRGSRSVLVPKLIGTSMREAELILNQNGLHPGGLCRIPSQQYERDSIIAQRPGPLQELQRGQSVDLLISDGPKVVAMAMPELRRRPLGQALQLLDRLGLMVAAVKEVHQPGVVLHTVVSQRPLAGYRVDRDSSIILKVNRIPRDKRPEAKFLLFTYQLPAGYFKKELALSQEVNGKEMLLYRKIHRPGDRLEWLAWARSLEEISLYVDGQLQPPELSGFHWENIGSLTHPAGTAEIAPVP